LLFYSTILFYGLCFFCNFFGYCNGNDRPPRRRRRHRSIYRIRQVAPVWPRLIHGSSGKLGPRDCAPLPPNRFSRSARLVINTRTLECAWACRNRSQCMRAMRPEFSVREYVLHVFQISKNETWLCTYFFEIITSKSRKKSLAKVLSSIFRNEFTYTSLSDRCNSVPSSPSVIHSEPLPNTLFICTVSSRSGCSGCRGVSITTPF